MRLQIAQQQRVARAPILAIAGMVAVILLPGAWSATIPVTEPSAGGVQSTVPGQTFEVASVKLNKLNERSHISAVPASGRLVITGMTVQEVVQGAYSVPPFQLITVDSPVLKQRIDIEAKTERPLTSLAQMQQMLQPLLADRFKLAVHRDMREMNALVLVLANKDGRLGPKMKRTDSPCEALGTGVIRFFMTTPSTPSSRRECGYNSSGVGRIVGIGLDMPSIVALLASRMPVVDQTGLQGRYDIDVTYTPEPFSAAALAQRGGTPPPGVDVDPNGPSLSHAVEEQLGLKLQPKKMPVPVVVIDHIESLTEN
jgi:uncharacterized protein (TIGR03435 family)